MTDELSGKRRFTVKVDGIEVGGFTSVEDLADAPEIPEPVAEVTGPFLGGTFTLERERYTLDEHLYRWMMDVAVDAVVTPSAPPGMVVELEEDPPLPGFKGAVPLKAKRLRFDPAVPSGTIKLEGPTRTVDLHGVTGPFRGPVEVEDQDGVEVTEVSVGGVDYDFR